MERTVGNALGQFGYIHVTGLKAKGPVVGDEGHIIKASVGELGRTCRNNGMLVAVTLNGEVWLAYASGIDSLDDVRKAALAETLAELCPNGSGAFVPCSNGEELNFRQVMARAANPCWTKNGNYTEAQYDYLLAG